jgi:hypothetical protein
LNIINLNKIDKQPIKKTEPPSVNSEQRKLIIKEFIAKVLTNNLVKDESGKPVGFKEKLQRIMDPAARKSSYESSLKKIREMGDQLDNLIVFLDEKMDNVLEKREKEFLSAYQSHMIEVQKELLHLKRKANEKELKLQQDDKILSLEQELAWIREETMKAREEIDNQEVLIGDLKLENQELEDDAKFLKDQLKECKTNNMKLKVALSKSHNKYDTLVSEAKRQNKTLPAELMDREQYSLGIDFQPEESLGQNTISLMQEEQKQQSTDLSPDELLKTEQESKMSKKVTVNTFPLKTEDVTKIDYFLTDLFESGKTKQEILSEISKFCAENQLRREKILEMHKRILQKKKKQKAHYLDIANTSKPAESQKNLVYFMQ